MPTAFLWITLFTIYPSTIIQVIEWALIFYQIMYEKWFLIIVTLAVMIYNNSMYLSMLQMLMLSNKNYIFHQMQ